jgi:hypothetical protein
MMVYTKQGVRRGAVPTPPSTSTLREPPSRESCSAATCSVARSSRIEARAARIAALDSAFTIDPTVEEIIYSDNGEGKYDDTSNEGDKDREEDGNNDAIGGNEDSEVDKDEDYVADFNDGHDDDDDNFYKSSLFDDDDDNSVEDAKYHVPFVRGAGAGRKPKSGRLDKPNTDGMSEKEKEEALGKWEKDWKRAQDRDRRKSAREEVDDTITYTGVESELLQTMTEVKVTPLKVGDTFPTKERMILRMVEEANLYGVCMAIKRSDTFQVDARGLNGGSFHVHGNFGIKTGWKVTVCVVGIKSVSCPATPNDTAAEKRTSKAGSHETDDPLVEIGVIGGQEVNPDNTNDNVKD